MSTYRFNSNPLKLVCEIVLPVLILGGCGGGAYSGNGGPGSPKVATIAVTATAPSVAVGATVQFNATAKDSGGNTISAAFAWTSSATNVATINSTGTATGVAAGTTQITASAGGVTSPSVGLTVTPVIASIGVAAAAPSVMVGATDQFTATARDSSGNTISGVVFTWASSATSVATINNVGLATGVAAGTTQVTASAGGVTSPGFALTVTGIASIVVTAAAPSVMVGATDQFTATAKDFSGNTISGVVFTWASSATSVATINSTGLATGVAAGTTQITASADGVTSPSVGLTVTPVIASIVVTAATPSVMVGATDQFTATAKDASGNSINGVVFTWASSAPSVATINSTGLATGEAAGTTQITASAGGVTSPSVGLTVTPALVSLSISPTDPTIQLINSHQQFMATGTYSDGSTKDLTAAATWTSGDSTVVYISNDPGMNGLATPIQPGSTTVSATYGSLAPATANAIVVTEGESAWTVRQLLSNSSFLGYSGSRYVLSNGNSSLTSTDGVSWHPLDGLTPNTQGPAGRMVWTGSQFVTFTGTSPDGLHWMTHFPPPGWSATVVAWSGTELVALGGSSMGVSAILTSPDGVTWTQRAPANPDFVAGTWNGAKFYVVGNGGAVQSSPDGAVWTQISTAGPVGAFGLAWSGTRFVAVGGNALSIGGALVAQILVSTDGVTWTVVSPPAWTVLDPFGRGRVFTDVVWSGTQFVAIGELACFTFDCTAPGYADIATSPDGLTWTEQIDSTPDAGLYSILWSGSQFVVDGTLGIKTSPDGVNWTYSTSPVAAALASASCTAYCAWTGVVWSGSNFTAVGSVGTIIDSTDGISWTARASNVQTDLICIAWNGSVYAVGMANGGIMTSSDGILWTVRTTGSANEVNSIVWSGSQFVAVGNGGTILTSPDGLTWTLQTSGTTDDLWRVATSGGRYVVAGVSPNKTGILLTSADALTWANESTPVSLYADVAWSGTQFVTWGSSFGAVLTSPDGLTWTTHNIPFYREASSPPFVGGFGLRPLIQAGTQLFAPGCSRVLNSSVCELFSSPDGIVWSVAMGNDRFFFSSMASDGSRLVGVGGSATGSGTSILSLP